MDDDTYENELDGFPTFQARCSRWTTSGLTTTNNRHLASEEPGNADFLDMLTQVAHLYAQERVLEMRCSPPEELEARTAGQGAVSTVTRLDTTYSQPSVDRSLHVDSQTIQAIAKRYSRGVWDRNGRAWRLSEARSFINELRILSHPGVRSSQNIVRILGLEWDFQVEVTSQPDIVPCSTSFLML